MIIFIIGFLYYRRSNSRAIDWKLNSTSHAKRFSYRYSVGKVGFNFKAISISGLKI
jgi:hypothetical protein